jgi:hypothetical protein
MNNERWFYTHLRSLGNGAAESKHAHEGWGEKIMRAEALSRIEDERETHQEESRAEKKNEAQPEKNLHRSGAGQKTRAGRKHRRGELTPPQSGKKFRVGLQPIGDLKARLPEQVNPGAYDESTDSGD